MGKKLKIYERFLLVLAFTADELVDFYKAGMSAYNFKRNFYLDPLSDLGYKPSNFYTTLSRTLKTGYIEKIIKNGKPYLRLTPKGQAKLKRDFPVFRMQQKSWDGKWRLVIFDIAEKSRNLRDALRDKLTELGFGMLQQSIYISPYDIVQDIWEFLKAQQLLGKAFVLTAKHELMGDPKDLARLVWHLDKIEEEYEYLWQDIIDLREAKDRAKAVKAIKNKYLEIIQDDPCLPKELLPSDWPAEEVRKKVVSL